MESFSLIAFSTSYIADCCYSGKWVIRLAEKLDEMGVRACGHHAKKVGCFLKIFASCYEDQVAVDRWYPHTGVKSAHDGAMKFSYVLERRSLKEEERPKDLSRLQDPMALDTTSMRCFHDTSSDCFQNMMEPCHQWKWTGLVKDPVSLANRFHVLSADDLVHWYAVFLHSSKYDRHTLDQMCERNLAIS